MKIFRHIDTALELLGCEVNVPEKGFGNKPESIGGPMGKPAHGAAVQDTGIVAQGFSQIRRSCVHSNDDMESFLDEPEIKVV